MRVGNFEATATIDTQTERVLKGSVIVSTFLKTRRFIFQITGGDRIERVLVDSEDGLDRIIDEDITEDPELEKPQALLGVLVIAAVQEFYGKSCEQLLPRDAVESMHRVEVLL
jgi:hypothetical protein